MAADGLAQPVDELLARATSVETLKAAFHAWDELREARSRAEESFEAERRRLEDQGTFLLGAVRSATAGPLSPSSAAALAPAQAAQTFLASAEEKLKAARATLDEASVHEATQYARAAEILMGQIRERIERSCAARIPALCLRRRSLPQERAILQLDRLQGDEPVLLLQLLMDLMPTHYGFLTDESTDDLSKGPTLFYPGEGVEPAYLHPTASQLRELIEGSPRALPLRAFLPFWTGDGPTRRLWRMVPRGPLNELEVEDGPGFRNILSRPEAEEAAGLFVSLRLAGKISLELEAS